MIETCLRFLNKSRLPEDHDLARALLPFFVLESQSRRGWRLIRCALSVNIRKPFRLGSPH